MEVKTTCDSLKTLPSKLLNRTLLLMITFWPHLDSFLYPPLLTSNVAPPPPPPKKRTHVHSICSNFSIVWGGRGRGRLPVLLIIKGSNTFDPHCSVKLPWAKMPKEVYYYKKVNNNPPKVCWSNISELVAKLSVHAEIHVQMLSHV